MVDRYLYIDIITLLKSAALVCYMHLMFHRIFRIIFFVLFISLNLTGQTISTVSKKITAQRLQSSGDGVYTVPSDLEKGSTFTLTFDQLRMFAEVTILNEQAEVVFSSGAQSFSSGNITTDLPVVELSTGNYVLKEKYYGQVDAAESEILIPTIEFQPVIIERAFRTHLGGSCLVQLRTQIYSLKAQVIGDFQGNVLIPTVGGQVELPLTSTRDLTSGDQVTYQTGFSVYANSSTNVSIDSRELLFDANKHSLLQENFDGLTLQNSVDEGLEQGISAVNVWTRVGPSGWNIDTLLASKDNVSLPIELGIEEWTGWSFAKFDWWRDTAENQGRGNWTGGQNVVVVLDSDEWDDELYENRKGGWFKLT